MGGGDSLFIFFLFRVKTGVNRERDGCNDYSGFFLVIHRFRYGGGILLGKAMPMHPSMRLDVLLPRGIGRGRGLNAGHHLLLGDEMVDAFQQAQQTLHAGAPLVQHHVGVSRFGEIDHSRRPVDLGVDGLGRDELADVGFGFVLVEVEQLG